MHRNSAAAVRNFNSHCIIFTYVVFRIYPIPELDNS